jgi:hypothetical protein
LPILARLIDARFDLRDDDLEQLAPDVIFALDTANANPRLLRSNTIFEPVLRQALQKKCASCLGWVDN